LIRDGTQGRRRRAAGLWAGGVRAGVGRPLRPLDCLGAEMAEQDDFIRRLRSPWLWTFWACVFLSILFAASPFASNWSHLVWTKLAECIKPGVRGADRSALALTYCMRTAALVMGIGVAAGAIEAFRNLRIRNRNETTSQSI
jgi:hypothetical protein